MQIITKEFFACNKKAADLNSAENFIVCLAVDCIVLLDRIAAVDYIVAIGHIAAVECIVAGVDYIAVTGRIVAAGCTVVAVDYIVVAVAADCIVVALTVEIDRTAEHNRPSRRKIAYNFVEPTADSFGAFLDEEFATHVSIRLEPVVRPGKCR